MCMLHEHRAVDLHVVKQLAVLPRHDEVVARHLTARCEWWVTTKVQVPKCRIPARRYGKLIRRCAPNVQHRRRLEHQCSCICRLYVSIVSHTPQPSLASIALDYDFQRPSSRQLSTNIFHPLSSLNVHPYTYTSVRLSIHLINHYLYLSRFHSSGCSIPLSSLSHCHTPL